jgi:predicted RNA polymerase sigma factor
MSEQDRNLAQMDEGDQDRHARAQALIQEAIDEVSTGESGRDPTDVKAALVAALARRGIENQPENWLESVATDAANGGRYIEDTRAAE